MPLLLLLHFPPKSCLFTDLTFGCKSGSFSSLTLLLTSSNQFSNFSRSLQTVLSCSCLIVVMASFQNSASKSNQKQNGRHQYKAKTLFLLSSLTNLNVFSVLHQSGEMKNNFHILTLFLDWN